MENEKGACRCMGEIRNAYRILFAKTEGERSRGRHRRRLNFHAKMDFKDKREDAN
jgi:hypothetical protein